MNMNKGGVMGTRSKSYLGVVSVLILMFGGGCTKSIQTDSSLDHANAGAKSSERRHGKLGAPNHAGPHSERFAGSEEEKLRLYEDTGSSHANQSSRSAFPSLSGVVQRDSH